MTYRSRKLLDAARDCPQCMRCRRGNDGSVVMAHSNQQRDGHGMGHKAADFRVAALCGACHAEIDNGRDLSREERVAQWEQAHRATIGWLFESGKVAIK